VHHRNDNRLSHEARSNSERRSLGLHGNATSPEQRDCLREHARQIRHSRDLRAKSFDHNMFGEPAWDILLVLYTIDGDRRRLNIRELSKLASLALTTALRWLDFLEQRGLITRKANPFDQRMVYAELSEKGRAAMDEYLLQMLDANLFGPIGASIA